MVVSDHTPADSDVGSGNDLQPVKAQGSSAGYSPAEVDNQVESVEPARVSDHQGSSVEGYMTYLDNIPVEEVVAEAKVLEQVMNYS